MKQVTILAVVILLTVTITSAKRVSKVIGDETTTEPEPDCMPDHAHGCEQASDCCSNRCKNEVFMGVPFNLCWPAGECYPDRTYYCGQDSDCCSGLCLTEWFIGGPYTVCGPAESCRQNRMECDRDNQCCSGHCKLFLFKNYCVEQIGST